LFKQENRPAVDVYVADTASARDALVIEGVPREKIAVIPTGVNVNDWSPDPRVRETVRARLHIGQTDIVVLSAHHPPHENGILELVHAARLLNTLDGAAARNVKYLVDGRAEKSEDVTGAINTLGLERQFIYYSGQSRLELFNAADMLYLPCLPANTWQEPSTMILRNAMAFGLPILARAIEAIPDEVGDAAILVPGDNPGAICAAIRDLSNGELRMALGKRAKQRAADRFSSDKAAGDLRRLFETVLQRR
jgi:glycosyltransferase involved in cell wall biosynthesis